MIRPHPIGEPLQATRRPRGRRALVAVTFTALAASGLAACSTAGTPVAGTSASTGAASSGAAAAPTAPATRPAAPQPAAGGVSSAVAQKLCDQLGAQLQSMRTYTLTPGKINLNGVVGTWAAQNGVDLLGLMRDRGRVDTITQAQCPDVRGQVLQALEIPTLASALVGI